MQDVWSAPAFLPYVHPPFSAAGLARLEERLGVKLPTTLIACLALQNGGYLRCRHPVFHHEMIWGIGEAFPCLGKTIADEVEDAEWSPPEPAGLVPFDGDGHTFMCLDYRSGEAPCVTYVDLELERTTPVASCFEDFLAHLRDRLADHLIVPGNLPEVATRLGQALGKTPVDQGDFAHGYPVIHFALGDATKRESAFLSPNQVTRGFRRVGDRVESLPDLAVRAAGIPAQTVLISCERAFGAVTTVERARAAGV
jgi:hypothetical protein